MKCLVIFSALFAISFANPIGNTKQPRPCAYVPSDTEGQSEPDLEATTPVLLGERASESQEFSVAPETHVSTESAEINEFATNAPLVTERSNESEESAAPETPAPTAAEDIEASTDAPAIFERLGEKALSETPAPTEASEELIPTTFAPLIAEIVTETPAAEEFTIAPETTVPVVVSFQIPVEDTPAPALRTPEVSEKPTVAPEDKVQIVVIPVSSSEASSEPSFELPKSEESVPEEPKPEEPIPEDPKPEETKPEEPKPEEPIPEDPRPEETKPEEPKPEAPKPENPKKLSRLITFTFYDRSSKATSLRHFLEYLRSLKK